MTQQLDAEAIKQQQKRDWGEAAAGWRKNDDRFREVTAPATRKLLELARIVPGHRVLDIACGTGEPALPAAEIVGSTGYVLATDISPEMLEVARDKAQARGLSNVEFIQVDGEELDVGPESFDAVTCRWGIMFMPEPVRCLRQAHRALKPGGRIAVSVWGPPERNPFIALPMGIARRHFQGGPLPDPTAPGSVFAFADASKLEFVFTQAGFGDTQVDHMELPMAVFDSGHEYWQYCREIMGPLRNLLEQVPESVRETIAQEVATTAGRGDPNGKVSLNGYPLFASATK